MANKEYYVWLVKCLGAGNPRSVKILEMYSDITEFYNDIKNKKLKRGIKLSADELKFLYETDLSDIEYVFERYGKFKAQTITIEDELYPKALKNIDNPPLVLFVVGDISGLDNELLLTVVGTRKESLYGKRASELICSELCVSGFSIVSGLAKGGDTTAHITALKCGARTYGFLACGLDIDYPYNKASLKNAIFKNGAVITEFLPGMEPLRENFRIRNRLMSGISVGTLVVESPKRSGTLITANHALNQGKDVFAVPSGIFWYNGVGTNELIKNGAKPVKDALDIIEEYIDVYTDKIKIPDKKPNLKEFYDTNRKFGLSDANSPNALSDEYKETVKEAKKELKSVAKEAIKSKPTETGERIAPLSERLEKSGLNNNENVMAIISCLESEPLSLDELSEKTGLPSNVLLVSTTKMELAGIVKKLSASRIELIK